MTPTIDPIPILDMDHLLDGGRKTPEPETYYQLPRSTLVSIRKLLADAEDPQVSYMPNDELAMCRDALRLAKLNIRSADQLLRAVCETAGP